jgi:hypothetical protein
MGTDRRRNAQAKAGSKAFFSNWKLYGADARSETVDWGMGNGFIRPVADFKVSGLHRL